MNMIISKFLKIPEISNSEKDNKVIKRAMSEIPRKDVVVHFCDYVENVDISDLKYLERLIVCKLRKDLNNLYLKIKLSKEPKNSLVYKIVKLMEGSLEIEKKEGMYEILDKLVKFTDDDCYDYIYKELIETIEWITHEMTLDEGAELILDTMKNEKQHLIDEMMKARATANSYEEKIDILDFNILNLRNEREAVLFSNKKAEYEELFERTNAPF